jgi:hypothetical protein
VIVTARAAGQLRALEPEAVAAILDKFRDRTNPPGATVIETGAGPYRAFIARHKDRSTVLVSIRAKVRSWHDRD